MHLLFHHSPDCGGFSQEDLKEACPSHSLGAMPGYGETSLSVVQAQQIRIPFGGVRLVPGHPGISQSPMRRTLHTDPEIKKEVWGRAVWGHH